MIILEANKLLPPRRNKNDLRVLTIEETNPFEYCSHIKVQCNDYRFSVHISFGLSIAS